MRESWSAVKCNCFLKRRPYIVLVDSALEATAGFNLFFVEALGSGVFLDLDNVVDERVRLFIKSVRGLDQLVVVEPLH